VKNKQVALFFFEGYLSAAPTILNLCSFFSEHDIEVTLFTRKISERYNQDNSNLPFHIEYIDSKYILVRRIILSIITRLFKKRYRKIYNSLIYIVNSFLFLKRAKKLGNNSCKFDHIIGVDPIGLIAANNFNLNINPIIYLSLEINYLFNNSNIFTNWVKSKEKKIHKNCIFTIIQDDLRMKCLCTENDLIFENTRYFLLPNSPRPKFSTSFIHEPNYFKSKFYLKQSDFIVLSAGMISDEVHSFDVANSFENMCDNIFLVLHERRSMVLKNDFYLNSLLDLKVPNLLFSLNPLEYSKIEIIFKSTDIGLAIYNASYGINYSNILFASGKISHYLKFGKPIIVNDLPEMKKFMNETNCGIVINDFKSIKEAILEIKNNYSVYSRNAFNAYEKHFNFDKFCKEIFLNLSQPSINENN
jgi:glycosyltransferase involved in cell wall biosynthesis